MATIPASWCRPVRVSRIEVPLTHAAAMSCLLADPPDALERDRCILSKGHICIARYITLAEGVLSA
jgi:transketolase N-terminal domain/subunit